MSTTKHYLGGSAKLQRTSFWKLSISFKIEDFLAQVENNGLKNDKGYVSLDITERASQGKFGDTHVVQIYDPNTTDAQLRDRLANMDEAEREELLKQLSKPKK